MLSHVEEVGKATLPDQAELDTLRSNVAKQQQKVDQLSTPQPSANGVEVLSLDRVFGCKHIDCFSGHLQLVIPACMQQVIPACMQHLDSFSAALLSAALLSQAHQACLVKPGSHVVGFVWVCGGHTG